MSLDTRQGQPSPGSRQGRAWIDQTSGVRIGYSVAGPAEMSRIVLLIHGAPQTGYAWRKVVPPLTDAGYQVVVPDYRGAGASTKPRDGYDKWTMAGDLHRLVHSGWGSRARSRSWATTWARCSASPTRCDTATMSSA
jgi:pimeloyl-ACP methyl ester carboxylesterase